MALPSPLSFGLSAGLFALQFVAAFFALRAIRSARTPQGAVGWAFFLMVFPLLGVPAFLVFGDFRYHGMVRARRSSQMTIHASSRGLDDRSMPAPAEEADPMRKGFEALAGRSAVGQNAAALLTDRAAFEAVFTAIANARRYILIETYILRNDRLGRALQERLIKKAREGVRVEILYDPFGSYSLDRAYVRRLREAGVAITDFHSRHGWRLFAPMRLNFRDHRKITVIDGETAFTGGFNFGDEYLGRNPALGAWRDTMVRLEGPVVAQMQSHFVDDWHWATGESLDLYWRPRAAPGGVSALVLASGPADARETGSLYFLHALTSARKRLWISTPYFTPDSGLMNALCLAAARGVDVRVIIPAKRDHWLSWLAAFAFLDEMRGSGVRFYRYAPGFIHQKVLLIDDAVASIGSHNLDSRSCRLNFEASALIFDSGFAQAVAAMLETDIAASSIHDRPLSDESAALRIGAPIARLFSPIL
ncbi:cardiolipin synthase [Rhodoblastus acidophilus]|uniref:Cardiolipin synthase n=1 Tax=Candidatus Rhodoblastus alkanivorans TaxID=2954117 RepID=A0ABS9Z321_9HYPH|nr:cardiolipin synthase [Candidatus Rhodoblastus alkanivorans]MCI4677326.1 cardiolipin synthase [Candidatus Rhodoblastus alkanivorans]MCI4682061.1 cardiolipin synthase [Candidatus Rhodoblastus alkanivorans]MDI4639363.1 cardiolipin synthase [Rhodoblastus acidophilus]